MDKLELSHIVGYLPYGLKVQHKSGQVLTLTGFSGEYGASFTMAELMDDKQEKLFANFIAIKPILRPMSDLDKEIPDRPGYFYRDLGFFRKNIHQLGTIDIDVDNMQYEDVLVLYQHNFDVHRLIDKGLAIDINTVDHG